MNTNGGARGSPRTQPAEVALLVPLIVTVAILLQPWLVLSQPSEQSLLYDFYNTTGGWASGCSAGWSTNTTPLCSGGSSSWHGVTCSAGSRVLRIILPGCGIRGTLPWLWSSLTNMQFLWLYSNSLSGTLPPQWSSLTNMQFLWLYSNSLSGTLPPQWSSLTNMRDLELYSNSLSGTLPPQWSSLTNMQTLYLHINSLNGTLPPQWSSLTNMQRLYLYTNSLSGTLPPQWSSLSNMQYLDLTSNSLSGTLPPQWSSLTNFLQLLLSSNSLSGTLPPPWSSLTNMYYLFLHNNFLTGTLPTQWSSLTNMSILILSNNSLRGTLPIVWSALPSTLDCRVNDNCLNTSNATAWWLISAYRNISGERSTGCIAVVGHGVSRGATSSLSNTRSESETDNQSMVFSTTTSMSATYSLPSGSYLSVSASSMSVGILGSRSVSISVTAQTWTGWSVTHSSATWSRWLTNHSASTTCRSQGTTSSSVSMPSLSETPTSVSRSQGTYSPSTASLTYEESSTNQVLSTMSLTPLCDAPPLTVNTSLRVARPNNESHCGEYLCPTASPSLIDGVGGVTLAVAYDAMVAAPSVLLLLAEDGIRHMWLSLLPSVMLGALDAVAAAAPSDGIVGVVVLRPSSGWPGLAVRPYAVQRLSLVVALRCLSENGTVVAHPTEMVLVVTPRPSPVAASVQAVVQSSQGIAGGLGSGGGAEAFLVSRIAMSLSMLSCDDALQGFGAGLGVVSVSGDLLAAVDTIVGNVVFAAGAAAAAVVAACVLYLCCASSSCSWVACCRDVLRLPLSLFPVFAATLPSTVMAVVAVLRDAPALSGGAASGAYGSIAVAVAVWGGALFLVGSATRRMALSSTLRRAEGALPDATGAVVLMFLRVFQSSTEWVASQAADATLFEGMMVLWFLPLDVCTTVVVAVVSALPLSRSAALCVGANAVNVFGCAMMLAVAAVRRPFGTAFGMVHSVVTYVMVLALAVCGLVLAATSSTRAANSSDAHSMLLAMSYLSGSAAALSALKAAVDAAGIVVATRQRLVTLMDSCAQSCVGDGELATFPVHDVMPEGPLCEDSLSDDPPLVILSEGDSQEHQSLATFGDLLDAYQTVDVYQQVLFE